MVSLDSQLNRIWSHRGNLALVCLRVFSESFKISGKTLNVGGSILWATIIDLMKWGSKLSMHALCSLTLDTMWLVASPSCHQVLPTMMDCPFTMEAKTDIPFKVLFYFILGGGHLAIAMRKVTNIEPHVLALNSLQTSTTLNFWSFFFYHLYLNSSKWPSSAIL